AEAPDIADPRPFERSVTIADMQPLRDLAAEQARTTAANGSIASAAEDLLKLLRDQAQDDAIEERSSAAFDSVSVTSTVAGAPRDELPGDRRSPGWWNLQPYSAFRIHGASQLAPLAPPRGFFFSPGLLA
ncbi:hypothetical protein, partial [Bosea sp. Root483D1]|uniref:hypothetical protein n=1 Tax=Bosea sp. Root483D1 TaxID=1736544 RepID=UPI00138F050A